MGTIQYTIRNIPPAVDQVIKKRAKASGNSFNGTVVELLTLQTLGTTTPPKDTSFDWLFAAKTLDETFDDSVASFSRPDERLWQ